MDRKKSEKDVPSRASVLNQGFYASASVNRLSRQAVVGTSPTKGGRFETLERYIQMNKLLAALIASFFAVGAFAADAAKPAASAAKAEVKADAKVAKTEAKADAKVAKTEAKADAKVEKKADEAKPAASAASGAKAKKEEKKA